MENYPQPGQPIISETPPVQPLSPADERTWAMLAHLSVVINLFTGFLGPVASLCIYLAFKDRSKYIAFQALQATVFQVIAWIGGIIMALIVWFIVFVTLVILIGICLTPLALLLTLIPVGAMVYGIVAGFQCYQGQNFHYYWLGPWLAQQMR